MSAEGGRQYFVFQQKRDEANMRDPVVGLRILCVLRFFDKAPAESAGVGEIDGELRVAVGAFRRLVKEVHVVALAASSILCVFHPLRGLALKIIANGLLSIMSFLLVFHFANQSPSAVAAMPSATLPAA